MLAGIEPPRAGLPLKKADFKLGIFMRIEKKEFEISGFGCAPARGYSMLLCSIGARICQQLVGSSGPLSWKRLFGDH